MHDWAEHIDLSHAGFGKHTAEVMRALDSIWAIPEGKELILRAAANCPNGKIKLGNDESRVSNALNLTGLLTNQDNGGTINLNFSEIARLQFKTGKDSWRDTGITETLAHELFHLADTNLVARRSEGLKDSISSIADHFVSVPKPLTAAQKITLMQSIMPELAKDLGGKGFTLDFNKLAKDEAGLLNGDPKTYSHYNAEFKAIADYINALGNNPRRLEILAATMGIRKLELNDVITTADVSKSMHIMIQQFKNMMLRPEELATDHGDYFLLRYFGIPPRENYLTSRMKAPDALTDLSNLPISLLEIPGQISKAVLEEAREYETGRLGRLDAPQLPADITTRLTQR